MLPFRQCSPCRIMKPPLRLRSLRHLLEKFSGVVPAVIPGFLHTTTPRSFPRVMLPSLKSSTLRSCRPLSTSEDVRSETCEREGAINERLRKLQIKLGELGIQSDVNTAGQNTRAICPMCGGGDSKERSFSLFIGIEGKHALWSCFRAKCGWKGRVTASQGGEQFSVKQNSGLCVGALKCKEYRSISEEDLHLEPLCPELIFYFHARSISAETLRRNAVLQTTWGDEVVIAFTYRQGGKLVSCRYCAISKRFWQEKDTETIFYGLDDIVAGNDIIIVDSEIDKLSLEEAGYRNCVSVPSMNASKVSVLPSSDEDTSFQYLWKCKEYFEKAPRILLATNADRSGQRLADELARRLRKERCWRVMWPKKSATEICKDANEVLCIYGVDVLKEAMEKAELFPIRGLFNFSHFFPEITKYYDYGEDFELGVSTGWRALDDFYNIVPGELTVITGVPNSGKSEWIDALLCNINESCGWKFALCSMENKVQEHARKLLEKHVKKPFFNYRYGESFDRMSLVELEEGKKWLVDSFHLIRCDEDSIPSIDWIIMLAKAAVLRHGVRGLVIDPYNELDHQRAMHQTETEYVSLMLTKLKRFAQLHSCHVWFVAHPKQLQSWRGNPPNLYDISGSAHFINKCDNGIVIHRNQSESAGPLDHVQICIRKVRNKVAGRIGDAFLSYDRVTGLFHDLHNP